MLVSKERLVRIVIGNQLFLRGREVKATVLRTRPSRLTLILGGSRTGQVQLKLVRSALEPPKTQVRAGCGVHENTRQYRGAKEANVNA